MHMQSPQFIWRFFQILDFATLYGACL
jgi:hypothetical protein